MKIIPLLFKIKFYSNYFLKREVSEIRKRKEYELDILSSKIHNLEEVNKIHQFYLKKIN
jgi:hypothetical protein